jgi:hypothetical protein
MMTLASRGEAVKRAVSEEVEERLRASTAKANRITAKTLTASFEMRMVPPEELGSTEKRLEMPKVIERE